MFDYIIFSVFLVVDAVDILKKLKKGMKKTLPVINYSWLIYVRIIVFCLSVCLFIGWLVGLSVLLTFDRKYFQIGAFT